MEFEYNGANQLLEKSFFVEDAVYAIQNFSGREVDYVVYGNSKCGSKCSSKSSKSTARGKSTSSIENTTQIRGLENKVD